MSWAGYSADRAGGGEAQSVKAARLQREFCTKIFLSYEFSYEKCSEISPEFFEPLFCVSEKNPAKSRKFPPNFPPNFPNFPAKNKKNHRRASAAQGEQFVEVLKNFDQTLEVLEKQACSTNIPARKSRRP